MVEISNLAVGIGIMFVLTAIAVGASVWGNTTGSVTNEEVLLMIQNNAPKVHSHDVESHTHPVTTHEHDEAAHSHTQYAVVAHNHNQYSIQSHSHTTSSGGTGDFDLYTSIDSRGDNAEDRFEDGDRVYIHGYNGSNERNIEWEIRDPDNNRIYSRNTGTTAFDDFFLQWEIPDNSERGTYTVIVEIDRDDEQITFFVQ